MDRTILMELKRISSTQRKTEKEIFSKWNERKPKLLDTIFNLVSKSIQLHSTTKLKELQRFADWQEWGFAIAESLKSGLGERFLNDINKVIIR